MKTKWTAEAIRSTRKKHGLTQAELAHRLGCRQQTISSWENDEYLPGNAYCLVLTTFFKNL